MRAEDGGQPPSVAAIEVGTSLDAATVHRVAVERALVTIPSSVATAVAEPRRCASA